ncbi:hypothetical protein HG537_0E02240 [Torulaspora globosa]|uniref:polynucleotide adenylyltransferase n=1 Tax=Torulaspora globosa TaxID=48254 RepID=A0A7H9HUB1_9SACH|nr:hypothetical protein HG537_0E02240 [Torulaspora sp. CBS 2947]
MGRKSPSLPSDRNRNNGTSSKKFKGTSEGKNRKKRMVKRMRKSSLSKAEKSFQVFNQVDEHVNKYENLDLDASDKETRSVRRKKSHVSDDILVIDEEDNDDGYDDYDGHYDSPRPSVPVVDVESENEETVSSAQSPQLSVETSENGLEANEDFIALSNSSEEETEAEEDADHSHGAAVEEPLSPSKRTTNTDYPWILNHDHSKQKEIADWLTMEIKDFVAYISPNRQEIEIRNRTISRIRAAVKELWPDADLHVFGSYATDLYLPGSDIDCVVNSASGDKENRNSLYSLASFLKQRKLASQVEVIAKARVPIIKFVEPHSQIHIDVSFERTNGLEAAKLIREWLQETPGLRELVLIVKQFLHSRRLNNVHTGGLGGFSIICLVYSFLHLHPRLVTGEIDPRDNLGVLLIDLFELYGKNFGYDDVGITVQDGHPAYIPKREWRDLQPGRNPFTLAIQDPGDPTNNISRGSFNLRDIKKSFAGAFDLLTDRCFELDMATFKDRVGRSILGNVIKYRGKPRDFNDERDLVENKAIIENENYHKKRTRIVHEEVFTDYSSDEALNGKDEDAYHIEEPVRKKRAIKPKNSPKDNGREKKKQSVDSLMGISNNDEEEGEDDYNPLEARESSETTEKENTEDSEVNASGKPEAGLKKITVDAQTRRDYWLGKSNA